MSEEKKKRPSRAERMYKDSPTMKRGEDGKMAVSRETKKADEVQGGVDGAEREEGIPVHARHAMERMDMQHKHEREHHTHDHGKHGGKEDMHKRHQTEMKSLHKRHQKELGHDGEEMIEKVESTEKEEE